LSEVIADLFITVDRYAFGEGAPAYFGLFGPDLGEWIDTEMAKPQTLLMGRTTFEAMSAITQEEDTEGGDRMTELPKLVFSTTLQEPLAWANSRVARDAVQEVASLKAHDSEVLRTIGSLSIVSTLIRAGLVDRLRLVIFPLILGSTGREPILGGLPDVDLELLDTRVLDDRLILAEYRPSPLEENAP
jgi:dihydrofolate reductase